MVHGREVAGLPSGRPGAYPCDLDHEIVGLDGIRYRIRPILPSDAVQLEAFHRRLGPDSVYRRFLGVHPVLSSSEVERFTCVDYVSRLALVAELGGSLIAVARFDRAPDSTEAEVAFVVADEFQHHGIGSTLLRELARAAQARGISALTAITLPDNRAMLDVFHHSGFPLSTCFDGSVVNVRLSIQASAAASPADDLPDGAVTPS
jgi:GNAT superfamily N-acetyltransferase